MFAMRGIKAWICLLVAVMGTTFPQIARAEVTLPTLQDDEVTKATGVQPDSRSLADLDSRRTYVLNRLMEISREERTKGNLEDALKAYIAAAKLNKDYLNQPELGFLYGDLNRWIEAKRVFDRTIHGSRWRAADAATIAEYCLKNKQVDIAFSYRKVLNKAIEDPDISLTSSRVLFSAKDREGAIIAAKRAYYLHCCNGSDASSSKVFLDNLTGSSADIPAPNRTFEKQFWSKVDKLNQRQFSVSPTDVKPLVDLPTFVSGYNIVQAGKIELGTRSDALVGAVRSAGIMYDHDYRPYGIYVSPNLLTCNLNKELVFKHLKEIGESMVPLSVEQLGDGEQLEQFSVNNGYRQTVYSFNRKGFKSLIGVSITWKTKGKPFLTQPKPFVPPNWTAAFDQSKAALKARRFKECRKQLILATVLWQSQRFEKKIDDATKRKEYEVLKNTFYNLYKAWGREDIADYFNEVSWYQLSPEVQEFNSDLITEFPTAAEFRHTKWKVSSLPPTMFDIQIPKCGMRMVHKDSGLYKKLATICGADSEEKEIYPQPPNFFDDEDFDSSKHF